MIGVDLQPSLGPSTRAPTRPVSATGLVVNPAKRSRILFSGIANPNRAKLQSLRILFICDELFGRAVLFCSDSAQR
jgi:hypothetical protein